MSDLHATVGKFCPDLDFKTDVPMPTYDGPTEWINLFNTAPTNHQPSLSWIGLLSSLFPSLLPNLSPNLNQRLRQLMNWMSGLMCWHAMRLRPVRLRQESHSSACTTSNGCKPPLLIFLIFIYKLNC